MLHTFLNCQIAVDFLRKALCWFNERENSAITSNSEEMPFGAATDNDSKNKKHKFLPSLRQILLSFPGNKPSRMYLGCFCPETNLYVENRRFSLVQFVVKRKQKQNLEKKIAKVIL